MKKIVPLQKYLLSGCLLLSLFAGCIKEPGPCIPFPQKPKWLLKRTTQVITEYIHQGPVVYSKYVHEYTYNQYYKPWLHTTSYSQEDTTILSQISEDTLHYDSQQRVIRLNHHDNMTSGITYFRQYFYNGNDSMPSAMEYHAASPPFFTSRHDYEYHDTLVWDIIPNQEGQDGYDTTIMHFNSRGNQTANYYHSYYGYFFQDEKFGDYDNAPNPDLFLNLSHAMALRTEDQRYASFLSPRISKNSWLVYYDPFTTSDILRVRTITYNAQGLVYKTVAHSDFPVVDFVTYYEYEEVE